MEVILEVYQGLESIYNGVLGILGFDPFLIFTVFLLVAFFKGFMGDRFKEYRKQLLTSLSFASSFIVLYVTQHPPSDDFVKKSIILGTITTFTYNIFKGTLQWCVDKLVQKLEQSTGKDYKDPELPL